MEISKSFWLRRGRSCKFAREIVLTGSELSNAQVTALSKDVKKREAELGEVHEMVKAHETTISAKQMAIVDLEGQRSAVVKDHEKALADRTSLQSKVVTLQADLVARDKERQQELAEKTKLQKALDELRAAMDAKTSEDIKRREVERSREAETADLRKQVGLLQEAQEKQRDNAVQLANKLRADVDALRQRHATAERDLATANQTIKAKVSEFGKLEAASSEAFKIRKAAEAELDGVRAQLKSTESQLKGMNATCQVGLARCLLLTARN